MKTIKRIIITTLLLVFLAASSNVSVLSNTVTIQAATTIKISKKTLALEVGQSKTLTVKGTAKKITWSTNKKAIATVSSKGKVTAKAIGKATITATVAGKKLTCAVTVTEPVNPYLKDAPFKAIEMKIGNFSFVMPSDWTLTPYAATETSLIEILKPNDTKLTSNIVVFIDASGTYSDYDALKATVLSNYTADSITKKLKTELGVTQLELSDYSQNEFTASCSKVMKTAYTIKTANSSFKQYIYDFVIGDYAIKLTSTDKNDLGLSAMIEYVINSVIVK